MNVDHVEGVSCLHMHDGMCTECAAGLENELRDTRQVLKEVSLQLSELDRLERLSHEVRNQALPRIGLGDSERASVTHARIIYELMEKIELKAPKTVTFPHQAPPEAVITAPIIAPTEKSTKGCGRYGLSTAGLYGVEFCNKQSAQATHSLVENLRDNLKVFQERAEEAERQRDYVWAYPAVKSLKEEVDRLTERLKELGIRELRKK